MTQTLLHQALQNTVGAALLATVALGASLLIRRPALAHVLWLLVLVKLLTPPIWTIAWRVDSPIEQAVSQLPQASQETDFRIPLVILPAEIGAASSAPSSHHVRRTDFLTFANVARCASLLWLLGSMLCSGIAISRLRRFHRLLKFTTPAPSKIVDHANKLGRRLALRGIPEIRFLAARVSPMLVGYPFDLCVLVPQQLWDELSHHQRDLLLLHELAHFRRRDHWVRGFELLVTLAFWWNPLLWFARQQLRINEEFCCDAWVTWAATESNEIYASVLIDAIDFASGSSARLPLLATGAGEFRNLHRRLLMIRNGNAKRNLGWTAAVALVALAGLPLSISRGQQAAATGGSTQPAAKQSVSELSAAASNLMEQAKFDEALEKLDQVLRLDPNNKWAVEVRPLISDRANALRAARAGMEKTHGIDPQIQKQIDRQLPELKFDKVGLGDVLEFLRDVTGANIAVDWPAMEKAGVDRNTEISLNLRNVKFGEVLSLLLRSIPEAKSPLVISADNGVFEISAGLPPGARPLQIADDPVTSAPTQLLLDRILPSLSFEGVDFGDVMDFMRDVSGSNIFVNWNALKTAGIDANAPVTLKLRNIKFSKALILILNNVSGGKTQLGYALENGVIIVTLNEELTRRTLTRFINIRDMLVGLDKAAATARQDAVIKLITQTVDPHSWKSAGGTGGDIEAVDWPPGSLLVTQSVENQKSIDVLFEQLRAVTNIGQPATTNKSTPKLRER